MIEKYKHHEENENHLQPHKDQPDHFLSYILIQTFSGLCFIFLDSHVIFFERMYLYTLHLSVCMCHDLFNYHLDIQMISGFPKVFSHTPLISHTSNFVYYPHDFVPILRLQFILDKNCLFRYTQYIPHLKCDRKK